MNIVTTMPHRVREIENCWIPMPDGVRLAARIWLPESASGTPVPAIVEYIPYRKRDRTRWRDEPIHRYFAGHGYAAVRIDLRGTGESDGLLLDEYLGREVDDGVAAIHWLAAQPWCSGSIGMMGKSWGGINALQVAARRPPELRAIITVCSTDDRYADDAHYMGGCLLNENLLWGAALLTINAQPPDPEIVGDQWRETWRHRLEQSPLFLEPWLTHQRRDAYWKHGSVCEDYTQIACPVFAVGGWADAYTNAVPRLLAGLRVPRKGLVGPWAHLYPHEGVPGPAIGFLQEALRWWDHWLRGVDTGLMEEPVYRVWMQESLPARTPSAVRPGRWVAEETWPSPRIQSRSYSLGTGVLTQTAREVQPIVIRSPQTVGLSAGRWCSFGVEGDLPGDQSLDDDASLVFDSEPLPDRMEILGAPVLRLELSVDKPMALLVARLMELPPDGRSGRVSYGMLNLTHHAGHENPQPLVPGQRYSVSLRLNDVAHAFPAGRRLRLALSSSYWPMIWPTPYQAAITVTGGSLELPVRPPSPVDDGLRPFEQPEAAPPLEDDELDEPGVRRTVTRDPSTGEVVCTTVVDRAPGGGVALTHVPPIDLELGHAVTEQFRIRPDDPLSARAEIAHEVVARRGKWSVRIHTRTELVSTEDAFHLRAALETFENETPFRTRRWERAVPRDLL